MSLATRCTACGTVFRVVQDQLKVSEGWVRCGRCNEVFNALEGLFDLEREAPPEGAAINDEPEPAPQPPAGAVSSRVPATMQPQPASQLQVHPHLQSHMAAAATAVTHPATAAPAQPTSHERIVHEAAHPGHAEPSLDELIDEDLFGSRPGEPDTQLAHAFDDPRIGAEFGDAHLDPELLTDEAALLAARKGSTRPAGKSARSRRDSKPEFLRAAERQAHWRRPRVRLFLALATIGLLAALTLQVAHHYRDTVAVKWPQTRGALLHWCAWMQCTIEPPRRIEDIFVESTTLARNPAGEGFRLAVNLRNRGTLPLALPSVDLNLTDGSGQLVARRVLSPRDFGTRLNALQPGADTSLQLLLNTGNVQVTGYTVEVFYP